MGNIVAVCIMIINLFSHTCVKHIISVSVEIYKTYYQQTLIYSK